MKHSYFCRESVIYQTKFFSFEKCNITITLLQLDDVYIVEISRFSKFDCVNHTSRYFEGVGVNFQSSFNQFQFVVKRYRHYEELYYNKKLRGFEKYL